MSEVDDFFGKLPTEDKQEQDIFGDKAKPEAIPEKDADSDEPEGRKNRKHRRLEEQNESLRRETIELAKRLNERSQLDEYKKELKAEGIDPRLAEVFGDNDAGKKVSKYFADILADERVKAKELALQEIEERQESSQREQRQFESFIDDKLEGLEDQYDVDLTSDAPQARKARREFLEMVQKFSPKDEDGTITGYADFDETYQAYRQGAEEKRDTSRNKEIASRSMQRSGQGAESIKETTPGFRGWMKDYNIE